MRANIRGIKSNVFGYFNVVPDSYPTVFPPPLSEGPLRQKAADRQPWHRDTKFFILVAQVFASEYQNQQSKGNLKEILKRGASVLGHKKCFPEVILGRVHDKAKHSKFDTESVQDRSCDSNGARGRRIILFEDELAKFFDCMLALF